MRVTVKTPARLHLGILDMNGDVGRLYGSIGVAIERPNFVIEGTLEPGRSSGAGVTAEGFESERVAEYARRFLGRYPLPGPVRLRVSGGIPPHVGLGSGTQLALGVGKALAGLGSLELTAAELGSVMGRGVHSGIGVAVFESGGFVVDGGHAVDDPTGAPPPVIFRHEIPDEWRFVVAVPAETKGLSAEAERTAFNHLPPAPSALVDRICRRLVMQMLPALVERDAIAFGQAMTEIQRLVGVSFGPAQGGQFAHSTSKLLIEHWLAVGACGAGQSSWGPAVYALAADLGQAAALRETASAFLGAGSGGEVLVVRGENRGATVSIEPAA